MSENILVTGVMGGMGRAACERLTAFGYNVIGIDRDCHEGEAGMYRADLCSEDSVRDVFLKIREKYDKISAIVNLAGRYDLGSLVEMDGDRIKKLFEVNFFAVCRVNRVFLPILSKGGKIIITSSELAPLDPLPFTGLYGVTKSTVEKYAFSLRMELNILGYREVATTDESKD